MLLQPGHWAEVTLNDLSAVTSNWQGQWLSDFGRLQVGKIRTIKDPGRRL